SWPVLLAIELLTRMRHWHLSRGEWLWIVEWIILVLALSGGPVLEAFGPEPARPIPTPASTSTSVSKETSQDHRVVTLPQSNGLALLWMLALGQAVLFLLAGVVLLLRILDSSHRPARFLTDYLGIIFCGAASAWFPVD